MKNAILFFIILATLCCNTEIYSQTSPVDDFSKFSKQDIPCLLYTSDAADD